MHRAPSAEYSRATLPRNSCGHLGFRVELPLFRGQLFLETFDLVGRVREDILHLLLVVAVDFLELELRHLGTPRSEATSACVQLREAITTSQPNFSLTTPLDPTTDSTGCIIQLVLQRRIEGSF